MNDYVKKKVLQENFEFVVWRILMGMTGPVAGGVLPQQEKPPEVTLKDVEDRLLFVFSGATQMTDQERDALLNGGGVLVPGKGFLSFESKPDVYAVALKSCACVLKQCIKAENKGEVERLRNLLSQLLLNNPQMAKKKEAQSAVDEARAVLRETGGSLAGRVSKEPVGCESTLSSIVRMIGSKCLGLGSYLKSKIGQGFVRLRELTQEKWDLPQIRTVILATNESFEKTLKKTGKEYLEYRHASLVRQADRAEFVKVVLGLLREKEISPERAFLLVSALKLSQREIAAFEHDNSEWAETFRGLEEKQQPSASVENAEQPSTSASLSERRRVKEETQNKRGFLNMVRRIFQRHASTPSVAETSPTSSNATPSPAPAPAPAQRSPVWEALARDDYTFKTALPPTETFKERFEEVLGKVKRDTTATGPEDIVLHYTSIQTLAELATNVDEMHAVGKLYAMLTDKVAGQSDKRVQDARAASLLAVRRMPCLNVADPGSLPRGFRDQLANYDPTRRDKNPVIGPTKDETKISDSAAAESLGIGGGRSGIRTRCLESLVARTEKETYKAKKGGERVLDDIVVFEGGRSAWCINRLFD